MRTLIWLGVIVAIAAVLGVAAWLGNEILNAPERQDWP